MTSNEKAKNYVDGLLRNLKAGTIRITPTGELQGDALNWGLATSRHEIEADILRRDPLATSEIQRFRDALAGKAEATPTASEPVPNTPPPKPNEPTLAERTLAAMRKLTAEVNARLNGN